MDSAGGGIVSKDNKGSPVTVKGFGLAFWSEVPRGGGRYCSGEKKTRGGSDTGGAREIG